MIAKIIFVLVSLFLGAWMIFDGLNVLRTNKYFGPEKPGPWADVVSKFGIDPMRIGHIFVVLGILWLIMTVLKILNIEISGIFLLFIPLLTIWYFPFGTIISILVLLLVFFNFI